MVFILCHSAESKKLLVLLAWRGVNEVHVFYCSVEYFQLVVEPLPTSHSLFLTTETIRSAKYSHTGILGEKSFRNENFTGNRSKNQIYFSCLFVDANLATRLLGRREFGVRTTDAGAPACLSVFQHNNLREVCQMAFLVRFKLTKNLVSLREFKLSQLPHCTCQKKVKRSCVTEHKNQNIVV